jgi:HEPN domain-containing protein
MTDKEKYINYWASTAKDDFDAVDVLFAGRKYQQALFFTHLSLEKIIKAHWVLDNTEDVPPKTHNLINLYEQTNLELDEEQTDFLQMMSTYQLEGRYPDYLSFIHQTLTKEQSESIISEAKILFQCLQEKLQ